MSPFFRRLSLVIASALLASSTATAKADALDAGFFGHWAGSGTVTDYVDGKPKAMERLIQVDIVKVGAAGFEVRNSQMTTMSDKEMRVSAEATGATAVHQIFQPVGNTGRWAAQKDCTDLTKLKGCGWAHLTGNSLVIDVVMVDAKGTETLLSTKRQLTDGMIKVTFRRISDGDLSRVVEGTMKNTAVATP